MDDLPAQIFQHLNRKLTLEQKKVLSTELIRSICEHMADFFREEEKKSLMDRIIAVQRDIEVAEFNESLKEF
jgi:hypothetical protein